MVIGTPGYTRDRQYGVCHLSDEVSCLVIDTAGAVTKEESSLDKLANLQTDYAIEEADLCLLVADLILGPSSIDTRLLERLRKENKTFLLVLNKCDVNKAAENYTDFHSLGVDPVYRVSAEHGIGFAELQDAIESFCSAIGSQESSDPDSPETPPAETKEASDHNSVLLTEEYSVVREDYSSEEKTKEVSLDEEDSEAGEKKPRKGPSELKVAIIGKPNAGKSSLINSLIGKERVVVFDEAGTTRDSVYLKAGIGGKEFVVIDTAGLRKRAKIVEREESLAGFQSFKAMTDAHICIIVVDAEQGLTDQDLHLIGYATKNGEILAYCLK